MGTDDPIKLGLAEKSKNLASLLAEFLFYPAPFAQRMHSCPFLHIRVHPSNRWFYIILSVARCDLLVRRVIFFNPLFVVPAGDIPHPVLVVEIPVDGFADAGFEVFRRLPT